MPNDVTMRQVVGLYVLADGSPCQGEVTFTPSARLVDKPGAGTGGQGTAENIWDSGFVMPQPVVVKLVDGAVSVRLATTSETDLEVAGWQYEVVERVGEGSVTYRIDLPEDPEPFDLAVVART
jgi:hypothetical protein